MAKTPNLGLDYAEVLVGGAYGSVINGALNFLDATLSAAISSTTADPPTSPPEGAVYILPASPTGVWAGQGAKIAFYFQGWYFAAAPEGQIRWVLDDEAYVRRAEDSWTSFSTTGPAGPVGPAGPAGSSAVTQGGVGS